MPVDAPVLEVMFKLIAFVMLRFVAVAFTTFKFVVVALFVIKLFDVLLPFESILKFIFSVQDEPFQNRLELVAVPSVKEPERFVQKVEDPFVDNTCPKDPELLFESKSFPKIFISFVSTLLKIGLSEKEYVTSFPLVVRVKLLFEELAKKLFTGLD